MSCFRASEYGPTCLQREMCLQLRGSHRLPLVLRGKNTPAPKCPQSTKKHANPQAPKRTDRETESNREGQRERERERERASGGERERERERKRAIHACMHACMHVCTYVLMYVFMYVGTHVRIYVCTNSRMYALAYVRMYVGMYVSTYVCMYLCIYEFGKVRKQQTQHESTTNRSFKQVHTHSHSDSASCHFCTGAKTSMQVGESEKVAQKHLKCRLRHTKCSLALIYKYSCKSRT